MNMSKCDICGLDSLKKFEIQSRQHKMVMAILAESTEE